MKKPIISTKNKEVYNKLNLLKFSPEVILNNVKLHQIKRIVDNINSDSERVKIVQIDDLLVLKRKKDVNFDVYLKK